jgi:hypothetical protein
MICINVNSYPIPSRERVINVAEQLAGGIEPFDKLMISGLFNIYPTDKTTGR